MGEKQAKNVYFLLGGWWVVGGWWVGVKTWIIVLSFRAKIWSKD